MVDAASTMALETLRDLLIKEVKFLSGVQGQVEDVGRDLQKMRRFLKDADEYRNNSAIVRGWVSDLIDLATSAEDVLEKYVVEVTSKREAKNLKEKLKRFACILCECSALHEIGNETAGIMSRMAQLNKDLESIRNGEGSSSFKGDDDQRLLRKTYGHGVEEHFVGMKNDIDLLVSHMQNDARSSRVISICGMGGLGKSTLARKIYQQNLGFEALAWVCITQKLQAKSVFQETLRQLLPGENDERVKGMEESELVRQLYDIQKVKKCLVILDDIWEIDHWNILKNAFPLAESKSKILLTTRNQAVADTAGFVHKLDFLTDDESWDLLQKIALPVNESEGLTTGNSKQFEAIGRELVCKCGRLPLAVSVIGGILRGQPNLGDWKKVLENMDSYLKHGKGVTANDKRVEQILSLSYDVLPYYLKLCFLYLGCFQEDEDIHVEDVYLIWMAEGLISSDDKGRNETLWDVAERYLNELASKCMVHVKLTDERLQCCCLHDLVRDLCLSKGKEEKFFENSQGKVRRLAIDLGHDDARSVAQLENANLRSLLLINQSREFYDMTDMWQNIVSKALLRSLKVLVLENCTFKDRKLPDSVRKLVMLKHLSIRDSHVTEAPNFVCKLPCLQSMDLRSRSLITIKLPNSTGKMGRLRHLFLDPYKIKTNDGGRLRLDGLTELETLIGFHSNVFDTIHLLKLTNLRQFDGNVDDIESLSMVVDHITKLKDQLRGVSLRIFMMDLSSEEASPVIDSLMHCPLNNLKIHCRLRRFRTWDPQFLHNLDTLLLFDSEIEEDPMETLQHLPALRNLCLANKSFVGKEMICGSKGFPLLKFLTLQGLTGLQGWRVEQGAMPNLSELTIWDCQKLKMIPQGMIFMASITKLIIGEMPYNFMKRLSRDGEDYHKISHIPCLEIGSGLY